MGLIVITGASGFIGRHFVEEMRRASIDGFRLRALTRGNVRRDGAEGVEWVRGDLDDPSIWPRLLEPGCTVVNLAYAQVSATGKAVKAMEALVDSCAIAKVRRLIHCSTISVYGRVSGPIVDEAMECRPIDEYGQQKLAIEQALIRSVGERFELAVVRPSAVFGAGGKNLESLHENLNTGHLLVNFLRASLYGRRKMHLVPVQTVVEAIRFICDINRPVNGEIFNVSCDDDPLNNFADVERVLLRGLGAPEYPVSPLPVPKSVLKALLRWRGRNEVDVDCEYSSQKLSNWGFFPSVGLLPALEIYAASRVTLRKSVGEAT